VGQPDRHQLQALAGLGVPYRTLRRLKSALTEGRRIPGRSYPDYEFLVHRIASAYGWTPQQIDEVDAHLLDWLIAIQGVEAEIREEEQKKQRAHMEREQAKARQRSPRRM
jgi:hypothetical protein